MASDPQSWAELESALGAWLDQDSGADQLRQFIALGERHLNRSLFTPDREAELAIAAAASSAPLPADFWGFKSSPWVDGSRRRVLIRLTPERLRATYPDEAAGIPAHYAIEGEQMLLGPAPTGATIRGSYYATIPALGPSQASNWLLTDHPDAYLAAALAEGFLFHMDEPRANFWAARRDDRIESINRAGRRRGIDSGALVASAAIASLKRIRS